MRLKIFSSVILCLSFLTGRGSIDSKQSEGTAIPSELAYVETPVAAPADKDIKIPENAAYKVAK